MVRDPDFVEQAVQLADYCVDLLGQVAGIHLADSLGRWRGGSSRLTPGDSNVGRGRKVSKRCRGVQISGDGGVVVGGAYH